jgi:hypothetical protein
VDGGVSLGQIDRRSVDMIGVPVVFLQNFFEPKP